MKAKDIVVNFSRNFISWTINFSLTITWLREMRIPPFSRKNKQNWSINFFPSSFDYKRRTLKYFSQFFSHRGGGGDGIFTYDNVLPQTQIFFLQNWITSFSGIRSEPQNMQRRTLYWKQGSKISKAFNLFSLFFFRNSVLCWDFDFTNNNNV